MGHHCYYFTTYDIFEEHCFEHCHEKRTSILPAESLLMWHIQTIEIIPLTWALHSSNDPALLSPSLQLQTTSNIEYVQIFRGWDANGQFSHSGHIENKSQHGPELCSSSVMPKREISSLLTIAADDPSVSQSVFTITEKALRHYAKWALSLW